MSTGESIAENDNKVKKWKEEKVKARYWAFIVYPDSVPENWHDILQKTGLEFAISPIHDKDLKGDEGKPHWHVIAIWGNTTTGATARRVAENVNATLPTSVSAIKGYYAYLTHKNQQDKHQYLESDIRFINGFRIENYVELSSSEVEEMLDSLEDIIITNGITEYANLIEYLKDNNMITERRIARRHTYHLNAYLRSRRYRVERMNTDPATGEVID